MMSAAVLTLKSVDCASLPIPGADPWYACEGDQAMSVMIDFRSRPSVTVSEDETIDEALKHLKHAGVRCAFVIDEKKRAVLGMLTAHDILGEKPQQYVHFAGGSLGDVRVRDIMQDISGWRVADVKDIEQSTVGDVLKIFHATGVTHLPVMETTERNDQRLRGLFSFAKIKRLLVK